MEKDLAEGPCSHDLAERLLIREIIESYFSGVDQKRPDVVAACFAIDAVATYHAGTSHERHLVGREIIARDVFDSCAALTTSTHSLASCSISIIESTASVLTLATSFLIHQGRVIVRGIRYQDTLLKSRRDWRIATRSHEAIWQFEQSSDLPRFI